MKPRFEARIARPPVQARDAVSMSEPLEALPLVAMPAMLAYPAPALSTERCPDAPMFQPVVRTEAQVTVVSVFDPGVPVVPGVHWEGLRMGALAKL